eukprot:352526-Chlamydomonas_euryale.AAC.5
MQPPLGWVRARGGHDDGARRTVRARVRGGWLSDRVGRAGHIRRHGRKAGMVAVVAARAVST